MGCHPLDGTIRPATSERPVPAGAVDGATGHFRPPPDTPAPPGQATTRSAAPGGRSATPAPRPARSPRARRRSGRPSPAATCRCGGGGHRPRPGSNPRSASPPPPGSSSPAGPPVAVPANRPPQTATPRPQRRVHPDPGLTRGLGDRAGRGGRPAAGAIEVVVRPDEVRPRWPDVSRPRAPNPRVVRYRRPVQAEPPLPVPHP
jgi:hypothetical protein